MTEIVSSTVNTSYNMLLVLLSFVIAFVGSFVALGAATHIRDAQGRLRMGNVLSAGLALGGVGVWTMHFIGMQGLNMDVGRSYAAVETLSSLVAAILATAAAFAYAARDPRNLGQLLTAGVGLGLAVVLMHYLGMFGLKIYGYIAWDYIVVGISILIAVVAATAALWLAFNVQGLAFRLVSALIMALAVCAMHYTGMSAAEFICTTDNRNAIPQGFGYLSSMMLPSLVLVVATMLTVLISIDQILQRAHLQSAQRR